MIHEGSNEEWNPRLQGFSFMAYNYPCAIIVIERLQQEIRWRASHIKLRWV